MSQPTAPTTAPPPGLGYWRGLDELADTPEFRAWVEREFPAGASELTDPVSRRHFVKIMSASFLLAGVGLTGCRRPEENILPFAKMPPGYVHGVPQYFATAMPARGGAMPLVAKSHDGRPTKVEGNPLFPGGTGATDHFAQASVLDLYDPDRLMRYRHGASAVSAAAAHDFLKALAAKSAASGGAGLCFLVEPSTSPSRERLQRFFAAKYPQSRWFGHEPVDAEAPREAATLAFGQPVRPFYKLDKARRILSLDCDFLGGEDDFLRLARDFAHGRKITAANPARGEDLINRLYVVESLLTLTGANADHRLRAAPSQMPAIAAALASRIGLRPVSASTSSSLRQLQALAESFSASAGNLPSDWLSECAADLSAHAGACVVMAGQRQPLAVHLLAHAMNAELGNFGKTVLFLPAPAPPAGKLEDLAQALLAGKVETLVVFGGNPAYTAPADLDWPTAQRRAKQVIRLGYHDDETSAVSDWLIPQLHYLESWGDLRTSDGTLVPVQPLVSPLFEGMTELELLARLGGLEASSPHEIVRATFAKLTGASGTGFQPVSSSLSAFNESSAEQAGSLSHNAQGDDDWNKFLRDGFLAGSAAKPVTVNFNWKALSKLLPPPPPAATGETLEVVFHRDYSLDDGRWNNNGWLQELPDPITKVVWENVVLLSPATFAQLGLKAVDDESGTALQPLVEIALGSRKITGPAWALPGMADGVAGLALGYGRRRSGRVGQGAGYDAYALRTTAAAHFATGATLWATGQQHPVSTTQSHWRMEGRPIVREADLADYLKNPAFATAAGAPASGPASSASGQVRAGPEAGAPVRGNAGPEAGAPAAGLLYPNPLDEAAKQSPYAWGLVVDLNACIGCAACVTACQSENNIPIVGKAQVGRSREMHWLRVDRYFAGPVAAPQVLMQPMMCQHCEAAPCESVCPVNATVHDESGLNLMVYNRCIGARYCSNNCPFKVRRFNFFDYHKRPLKDLRGPVYPSPLTHATDGRWDLARWWQSRDDSSQRPEAEWNLLKLVKNPQVTVRMRGVMEKCTYCVQRIEEARIARKVQARDSADVLVADGAVKTACQQACPTEAITFGNLKDPASKVSQLKAQSRNYTVLGNLGVKPRTSYLVRVRNPNPRIGAPASGPASLNAKSHETGGEGAAA